MLNSTSTFNKDALGEKEISNIILKKSQDYYEKETCSIHLMRKIDCSYENCGLKVCQLCIFKEKKEIEHYEEHFDFISLPKIEPSPPCIATPNQENAPLVLGKEKEEENNNNEEREVINQAVFEELDTILNNDLFYDKVNNALRKTYLNCLKQIDAVVKKYSFLPEFKVHVFKKIQNNMHFLYFIHNELIKSSKDKAKRILKKVSSHQSKINSLSSLKYSSNSQFSIIRTGKTIIKRGIDIFAITNRVELSIFDSYYRKFLSAQTASSKKKKTGEFLINPWDSIYPCYIEQNLLKSMLCDHSNREEEGELSLSLNTKYKSDDYVLISPICNYLLIKLTVMNIDEEFSGFFWRYYFGFQMKKKKFVEENSQDFHSENPYVISESVKKKLTKSKEKESAYYDFIGEEVVPGIYLQSNGWVCFPGSLKGNSIQAFERPLKKGDVVSFLIDPCLTLSIGLNEENRSNFKVIMEDFNYIAYDYFSIKADDACEKAEFKTEFISLPLSPSN